MIEGSCHCGAVRFELADAPAWLTQCNCSLCRRTGGLWAHAEEDRIRILCGPDATIAYVWGDKTLATHSCRVCGCTTHWTSLDPASSRMAVNCRMAEPEAIEGVRIRVFDGADTWTFLD